MSTSQSAADTNHFAVFGIIMSGLTIGALVGNIICFRMTKRLLKNKRSLALVLNLNISDIIVAMVSWTGFMFQNIAVYHGLDIHVVVHKVFWSILVTLGNVTLLTLTGLALDCFVALRWPLHYKEIVTYKCINVYIGTIWVCSVLAGASDFLVAATRTNGKESYFFTDAIRDSIVYTDMGGSLTKIVTASITMLISNALSFLCLVIMISTYAYILKTIRHIYSDRSLSKQGGFKSEIHAVRTTLMIFTSFLLLWLPTLVINVVSIAQPDYLSKLGVVEVSIIGYTADTLLMVHSIVDALIYGVRVKKTIQRQRKSRKDQAGFSRANTFRRTRSSDRSSPDGQEDMIDTLGKESRRLRSLTVSSLGTAMRGALTTVSGMVESLALTSGMPVSDDSGINSPHKLSPVNSTKSSHIMDGFNSDTCSMEHKASDHDDEMESQVSQTLTDTADDNSITEQPCGWPLKVRLVTNDDNSITIADQQSATASPASNNFTSQPNHITGQFLTVPRVNAQLRSSLKKLKIWSNTPTQDETMLSNVRFSQLKADKPDLHSLSQQEDTNSADTDSDISVDYVKEANAMELPPPMNETTAHQLTINSVICKVEHNPLTRQQYSIAREYCSTYVTHTLFDSDSVKSRKSQGPKPTFAAENVRPCTFNSDLVGGGEDSTTAQPPVYHESPLATGQAGTIGARPKLNIDDSAVKKNNRNSMSGRDSEVQSEATHRGCCETTHRDPVVTEQVCCCNANSSHNILHCTKL